MSSAIHNLASLNALFKPVFADKVNWLIPEYEELVKTVPFVGNNQKNGGMYNQPVILGRDHGVTFLGENDNILNLEEPVVPPTANAQIRGSALTMRTYLTLTAMARAAKGPRAFVDATRYAVESLTKSFASVQEQIHWHGRSGLGYGSVTTGGLTITIDAAEFAEAIWVGAIGMPVELRDGPAGAPGSTLKATAEVVSVNMSTRVITLSNIGGATTGQYNIVRKGSYGVESYGLMKILANTGSLFNIDAATYDMWKANQYVVGGALNFANVSEAIALAQGRGLQGSIKGYVHPLAFRTLLPDYVALKSSGVFQSRTLNESESKNLAHGTKTIQFYVNSVEVDILATNYMKRGQAAFVNMGDLLRVGSTAPTFSLPGLPEGEYFQLRQDQNAVQLRMFSDEALFCAKPANTILFSSIVV
jgi:hypothetical protein